MNVTPSQPTVVTATPTTSSVDGFHLSKPSDVWKNPKYTATMNEITFAEITRRHQTAEITFDHREIVVTEFNLDLLWRVSADCVAVGSIMKADPR